MPHVRERVTDMKKIKTDLPQVAGRKDDGGKPPISLVPAALISETAKVLAFGAQKYDCHNWRKGIEFSRLLSATFRHLIAFNEGQDLDPESGVSHLAHASCNIGFLLTFLQDPDKISFDDRFARRKV